MRVLHVVLNDIIRIYVSDIIDLLQLFYFGEKNQLASIQHAIIFYDIDI